MAYQVAYEIEEKYDIIKQLGQGQFGAVYLVHDKILNKQVALKIVNYATENTFKEAQAGNIITHDNLVKIHSADYIKEKKHLLIVMDYCQNGSVVEKLNSLNFIPLSQSLQYIKDILRGLDALHGASIFHNDIKPQNILIGEKSEGILTDYGIAMLSTEKAPIQAEKFYLPHYPPECIENRRISISTDIYQVGLTLFRLINGCDILNNKFNSVGVEGYKSLLLTNKLIINKDYLDFVPTQVKKIINTAINNKPEKRYMTARKMRHALEQIKISGDWTVDSSGNYIGEDHKYYYSFAEIPCGINLYIFKAFKKAKDNGRETQIHKYDKKRVPKADIDKTRKRFMTDVVNGGV